MLLREALPWDVWFFNPHKDDLAEASAAGIEWREDITEAVLNGCLTVFHSRHGVLAMGGNNGDQCWFVTSESISELTREERLDFRKVICEYRDSLFEQYQTLWNFVWVGNRNHIRFLKSIGAVFHEEYTASPLGERFQLFTITGG